MSFFTEQLPAPVVVEIGGREFRFRPLRLRDHAEAAERMQRAWRSPRDVVRRLGRRLSAEQQRQLLMMAYRDERRGGGAELEDVLAWYRTPEGALVHKWLMLRREHPELSLDDVDELLQAAAAEELARVAAAADAADGGSLGNRPGPPETAGPTETMAAASPGGECVTS